ncbi:MAG: DHCW motif cupin fold protein [Ferruginibacter sp.]|nr:DHCW motif cupin fold protein [Ferruginibacter sp.]
MKLAIFPFQTLDWSQVEKTAHKGTTGSAIWQVFRMNDTRIRMVEYSPNYLADHWCSKGHIIYCIEGEMHTSLKDGRNYKLSAGMTYHVGDDCEPHQSRSAHGCKLFIVD